MYIAQLFPLRSSKISVLFAKSTFVHMFSVDFFFLFCKNTHLKCIFVTSKMFIFLFPVCHNTLVLLVGSVSDFQSFVPNRLLYDV
jgi:hypothetical protein